MIAARTSLDQLYKTIMEEAHLDAYVVARPSSSLGALSFVEMDVQMREYVMPLINELNDVAREKARFMLDICTLNLLRKGQGVGGAGGGGVRCAFFNFDEAGLSQSLSGCAR